jgi:hypothetical protein
MAWHRDWRLCYLPCPIVQKSKLHVESAVGFVEIGIKSCLRLRDILHTFRNRAGDSGGKRIVCFAIFQDQVSERWTGAVGCDGGFLDK